MEVWSSEAPDSNDLHYLTTENGLSQAKTVEYKCSEGFKLQGTSNRTCQSGGTWSGLAPTCVYVQCGQLSLEG